MRELTDHLVEGDSVTQQLQIEVMDEPGAGGANHVYAILGITPRPSIKPTIAELEAILASSPAEPIIMNTDGTVSVGRTKMVLTFQDGAIKEVGVNGVTHEALLAIVIDRLQIGRASCRERVYVLV